MDPSSTGNPSKVGGSVPKENPKYHGFVGVTTTFPTGSGLRTLISQIRSGSFLLNGMPRSSADGKPSQLGILAARLNQPT